MTRLPRLKGKELVRLFEKRGFQIVGLAAAIYFCVMWTGESPLCQYMQVRRLGQAFFDRSCATSSCLSTTSFEVASSWV